MVSKSRTKYPNVCYHIYSRGVDQRTIFQDDLDFKKFLNIFSDVYFKRNFKVHAYCLMNNHYHFCIETPEQNIGDIMRDINSKYVLYFNQKYQRKGRLFEGPYNDKVVDTPSYFLILISYIHCNPLEAGLVKEIDKWAWSSYSSYIDKQKPYAFLYQNKTLKLFQNINNFIEFHNGTIDLIYHPNFTKIGFLQNKQ